MAADVAREMLMAMKNYSTRSDPDMLFTQAVTSVQHFAGTGISEKIPKATCVYTVEL